MIYIGIDVSKLTFDVAVLHNSVLKRFHFENTHKGNQSFVKLIKSFDDALICCMEATGVYGLALAKAIHQASFDVIVVNPIKTHAFAKVQMLRNKTDRGDALMIAQFCKHLADQGLIENHLFTPKGECFERLQYLFTRLEQLKKQHNQENNRLDVSMDKACKRSIKAMVKFIEKQMNTIELEIQSCVQKDEELNTQVNLLTSIDGIGSKSAWAILAYLGDVNLFQNSRQVTSFAGLNPRVEQSGSSVNHSRLSRMGHRRLRRALYMPALVATRHNELAGNLYLRMLAKGKPKKVAIVAVMRKLLVIAYGVLKSQTNFDPNYQP